MGTCMGLEAHSKIQMVQCIMVILNQVSSMEWGLWYIQTEEAIMGVGLTASRTVMVYRHSNAENLFKGSGSRERESHGLKD
jgi:hypothetical protein